MYGPTLDPSFLNRFGYFLVVLASANADDSNKLKNEKFKTKMLQHFPSKYKDFSFIS